MKTLILRGWFEPIMSLGRLIWPSPGRLSKRRPNEIPGAIANRCCLTDQAAWNRWPEASHSSRRAGARGGSRVGRTRWARMLTITGGASMAAMIFKLPPQFAQCSIAMSKTRLSKRAQRMRAGE
jgi:hypothetical protein